MLLAAKEVRELNQDHLCGHKYVVSVLPGNRPSKTVKRVFFVEDGNPVRRICKESLHSSFFCSPVQVMIEIS